MFEVFRTELFCYLYDAVENRIIMIDEEDYRMLDAYLQGEISAEVKACLEKYRKENLCLGKEVQEIEHTLTDMLPFYLEGKMGNLILQVTQQCNLRCSYCTYSGKYVNRVHSNQTMEFETARRAIDFFMNRNLLVEQPIVGFYGGEPLLQFELIKQIVKYVEDVYPDRKVSHNITVNGTLLNREAIAFFAEHNFTPVISLDGPREVQDKNRCYTTGKGTYEEVIKNLGYIKDTYPELWSRTMTNTVLSHDSNYEDICQFFEEHEYMRELKTMGALISESGLKNENRIKYSQRLDQLLIENRRAVIDRLSGTEGNAREHKLFSDYQGELFKYWRILQSGKLYLEKNHPGGPCIIGAKRLFVTTDGSFYSCEKIPEMEEYRIGSIEMGFDMGKIRKLMNVGKLTAEKCKKCWNFQFCGLCVSRCITENGVSKEYREELCKVEKNHSKEMLKDICILTERGKNENISSLFGTSNRD